MTLLHRFCGCVRLCFRRSKALVLMALLLLPGLASAHNYEVHRDMTEMSYEIMILVGDDLGKPPHERRITRPADITPADWEAFLKDVDQARRKLQLLKNGLPLAKSAVCERDGSNVGTGWAFEQPNVNKQLKDTRAVALDYKTGSDCGVEFNFKPTGIYAELNKDPRTGVPDASGEILGFWAADIDDHKDDTHFFIKPTSIGGLGAAEKKADELITDGISIPLIPLFCLFECIFGGCDDCARDARDFADSVNPTDEIIGLIPGFGDISGLPYVGVWHFMGMQPGADPRFDDPSGYAMDNGGPFGKPDAMVTGMIAVLDWTGMTLNWDKSDGPKRYEITGGNDFHRNTSTRSRAKWMFPPFPHLIFEPADNLGKYGWNQFKSQRTKTAEPLSFPLHALGDATVPMHVVNSSGWGHRPFEDAVQDAWPRLLYLSDVPSEQAQAEALQREQANRILVKAYGWRKFILDWRSSHPGEQETVPIRDMVTELAQQTFNYANSLQATGWPYSPTASLIYLADPGAAKNIYLHNAEVDHTRPLIENGIAATLAFLVSAMER